MNFEEAQRELKTSCKIARKGWNGNGMFIYLVDSSIVPIENLRGNVAKHINKSVIGDEKVPIHAHIDTKTSDGKILVGWYPSQFEMFAEDWQIV